MLLFEKDREGEDLDGCGWPGWTVVPKKISFLIAKIVLALHKRGWGQLGRTAVGFFSEGMNLFIE